MYYEKKEGEKMRFIHCADLHLDSKMTANLSKEKAKIRKIELLNTFKKMVNYASDNQIKGIIIAGDLYDTKNISATAKNAVIDEILNHPELDFYYLLGNHDGDSLLSAFSEMPDNLKLFNNSWTDYKVENTKIHIIGIEISEENNSTMYDALTLNPNDFNIVVLHGQEAIHKSKDKNVKISLRELKNKNIDYLALGHIHQYKREKLDSRGIYCYSGCLEGRGFDECGEHGFVVIDIDDEKYTLKSEFINMASRQLYNVLVDVSECLTTVEVGNKINDRLLEENIEGKHMVKVSLVGKVDIECDINIELLTKQFEENYFFFKIKNETALTFNYEKFALDVSLKGEFVRTVMQEDSLEDEEKATIIRYGLEALAGEEID